MQHAHADSAGQSLLVTGMEDVLHRRVHAAKRTPGSSWRMHTTSAGQTGLRVKQRGMPSEHLVKQRGMPSAHKLHRFAAFLS